MTNDILEEIQPSIDRQTLLYRLRVNRRNKPWRVVDEKAEKQANANVTGATTAFKAENYGTAATRYNDAALLYAQAGKFKEAAKSFRDAGLADGQRRYTFLTSTGYSVYPWVAGLTKQDIELVTLCKRQAAIQRLHTMHLNGKGFSNRLYRLKERMRRY